MVRHKARAASCQTAKVACTDPRTAAPPGSAYLMAVQYAIHTPCALPCVTLWVVFLKAHLLRIVSACPRHRLRTSCQAFETAFVQLGTAGRRAICYRGQRAGLHSGAGAEP